MIDGSLADDRKDLRTEGARQEPIFSAVLAPAVARPAWSLATEGVGALRRETLIFGLSGAARRKSK